jgi:hypothetical protein
MRSRSSAEALEPIPPTLRDGEPKAALAPSGVVPRPSAGEREAEEDALALLAQLGDDAFPGRILAALGPLDQAPAILAGAAARADARGDMRTGARARHALGLALWAQGEASCREALEDAGTLFEELGDDLAVRAIDALLRDIASGLEESPRSFARRDATTLSPPPPRVDRA